MLFPTWKIKQLPLQLEFYSTNEGRAQAAATVVQKVLKKDYSFRLSTEFEASSKAPSRPSTVNVTARKMDWNAQQAELDKMFDKSLELQYKDLPDIPMSTCLKNISLMDYQVLGIKWLVKRETKPVAAPFYKKVKENKSLMYLCEITQSSQAEAPSLYGGVSCVMRWD